MSPILRLALGLSLGLIATASWAADEAQVLRQRAEQLAVQGRCEEALTRAEEARALDPTDARAALVAGRCQLLLGRYGEAIEPLTTARRLDPSLPQVSTDLAQCHYHLGEFAQARDALEAAERQDPEDGRMHLYRGLLLLEEAKEAEAAAAFDRAGSLDPTLAETASLYAGRTWASVRDRERATAALERARDSDPDSEWGREAGRELERLEGPYKKHRWARLRGGMQYDDNVALRIPGEANDLNTRRLGRFDFGEDDSLVTVFDGELGAEFLRDPDRSAGVIGGYEGSVHGDTHEFDLQYPRASVWFDQRIAPDTFLRVQPFLGYAWLETDPFVFHGGTILALSRHLSERWIGQAFGRINFNNYLFRIQPDPVLVALDLATGNRFNAEALRRRDRDGWEGDLGVESRYTVAGLDTTVRGSLAYQRYEAEGKDWDRDGYYLWLTVQQPLPLGFEAYVRGSFTDQYYEHRSSFLAANRWTNGLGSKRRDQIFEVETELKYRLTDWAILSARYQYIDNDSNTPVFDYDRHIAGGYLTLSWED